MAVAADHQMVVQRDADLVQRLLHLARHGDVAVARRRVARRVIVDDDQRGVWPIPIPLPITT